jgi:hypothetical protein
VVVAESEMRPAGEAIAAPASARAVISTRASAKEFDAVTRWPIESKYSKTMPVSRRSEL